MGLRKESSIQAYALEAGLGSFIVCCAGVESAAAHYSR